MKVELSFDYLWRSSVLTSKKKPTIILLHGYGSNKEDLFSFVAQIDEKYQVISVEAPYKLNEFGSAWYSITYEPKKGKFMNGAEALTSRDNIVKLIDEVVEYCDADAERIILMGFSQGAILSYAVALSFPEKVQQVVAMSGYIAEDLLVKEYRQNDFSHLRIFSSHGEIDQVVPVEWDRKTPAFLKMINVENVYREYPVGHGVHPDNLKEALKWLK